jgi:hypothetical protein
MTAAFAPPLPDNRLPDPGAPAPPSGPLGRSQSIARLVPVVALLAALWIFASPLHVAAVALLLFMIFMHELGHYLTARRADMKVTEFFIGVGPRIWSFRRGETEY